MPALTSEQVAKVFRPYGPKAISVGNAFAKNGKLTLNQAFDLALPILGVRLVIKGRVAVGTANYTNVNPFGVLGLVPRVQITGTNARQGGNVTLVDTSLANAWILNSIFNPQGNLLIVNSVARPLPTTPLIGSATATTENSYFLGTTAASPYDFIIACDIPFHPHGLALLFRTAFGVRKEEYANTLAMQVFYDAVADAAENGLGLSAGTSVTTLTAFGSGAGSPTVDVYALPFEMGLDMKDTILPGVISRVDTPVGSIATAAGANVQLSQLQPQPTTRVYLLQGTSTNNPHFKTLVDTNITALGVYVGGNRAIRELDDIWAHKQIICSQYGRPPIIGVNVFDFIDSGSPFSAFPGDNLSGAYFTLQGTLGGVANGYAVTIQEQMIWRPSGQLFAGT